MKTTIKIEEETAKQLNLLKYNLGAKNHDQTILKLIKIAKQVKTYEDKK